LGSRWEIRGYALYRLLVVLGADVRRRVGLFLETGGVV